MSGWLGCDLDGTLTEWDGVWRGPSYIGAPIARTVRRVKHWLNQGKDVRIFTARVHMGLMPTSLPAFRKWLQRRNEANESRQAISALCTRLFGQTLPITCEKDYQMALLLDDRAQQVVPNTGALVQEELRRAVQGLKTIAASSTDMAETAKLALSSLDPWSQKLGS